MALEFWTVSGAPSPWRVALAMAFKGITSETHMLSAANREHKSESYLALNPRGTVPTLKEGALTLGHSIAILAWLDRKYPDAPLFGETAQEAGEIWQNTMELFDYLPPATSRVLLPVFFDNVTEPTEDMKAGAEDLRAELRKLARLVARQPFLSGQRPGAVDAVAFPHVRLVQRAMDTKAPVMRALGFTDLAAISPDLADWVTTIEAIPGVAQTFPPHWEEDL